MNAYIWVWVQFYELNWIYWHTTILNDISQAIGVPLQIDNSMGILLWSWLMLTYNQPSFRILYIGNGTCLWVSVDCIWKLLDFWVACHARHTVNGQSLRKQSKATNKKGNIHFLGWAHTRSKPPHLMEHVPI